MSDTLVLRLMRFLPKNLLSRGFGWIARRERPRFLVRPFMRWFAGRFGIDLDQAEYPFEHYPSLQAMFTRRLKPGLRPIAGDAGGVVSPVDGVVGAFGRIERGRAVQAKGLDYTIEALLGSAEAAVGFEGGHFATVYLSPRDYHRIHVPVDGGVVRTLYEPGTLWPVNPPAVRTLPNLFAVNERITSVLDTARGSVAVVLVGATNVGAMQLVYLDFECNRGGVRREWAHDPAVELARGDHLGTFQMGSTIVLLVAEPDFAWEGLEEGRWLPMGSLVGRYGG